MALTIIKSAPPDKYPYGNDGVVYRGIVGTGDQNSIILTEDVLPSTPWQTVLLVIIATAKTHTNSSLDSTNGIDAVISPSINEAAPIFTPPTKYVCYGPTAPLVPTTIRGDASGVTQSAMDSTDSTYNFSIATSVGAQYVTSELLSGTVINLGWGNNDPSYSNPPYWAKTQALVFTGVGIDPNTLWYLGTSNGTGGSDNSRGTDECNGAEILLTSNIMNQAITTEYLLIVSAVCFGLKHHYALGPFDFAFWDSYDQGTCTLDPAMTDIDSFSETNVLRVDSNGGSGPYFSYGYGVKWGWRLITTDEEESEDFHIDSQWACPGGFEYYYTADEIDEGWRNWYTTNQGMQMFSFSKLDGLPYCPPSNKLSVCSQFSIN